MNASCWPDPPPWPIRVLVYGGRDFNDRAAVFAALDKLQSKFPMITIVHGGCRGADALADAWANSRRQPVDAYPADWKAHGRAAGPMRNQKMVESGLDAAIEFPGGRGTADMRARLEAAGVRIWRPVREVTP